MNTCYYQIQTYSYKPTKKVKTLEERKETFRAKCKKALQELGWYNEKDFPTRLRLQWVDKWEASNGIKMAWEREKVFDIKARLRTFRRNDKNWNAKLWEEEKKPTYKQPRKEKINYPPINYDAKRSNVDQPIGEVMGAGSRLKTRWDS